MPRWLTIVISLVTLVVACAGLLAWDRLMLQTATASDGPLGIWVYNPYVRPGDTLRASVGVYSGLEAAIGMVQVQVGEDMWTIRGEGADWGERIMQHQADKGSDAMTVEVLIPQDAAEGQALDVVFDVWWVIAGRSGDHSFENSTRQAQATVPLVVHSAAGQTKQRAANVAAAVLGLGACSLGMFWLWPWLAKTDESGNPDDAETVGLAVIIGGMAMGFVGYWIFALPLMRATGITATWFAAIAVVVWVVLPPALGFAGVSLRERRKAS